MMMLSLENGGFVAVSEVVELQPRRGGEKARHTTTATLRDGRTVSLSGNIYELVETFAEVVPAFAGFELLTLLSGDQPGTWETSRQPVIAWRVYGDGRVEPVGPEGTADNWGAPNVFKLPDGKVMNSGAETLFDAEADWFRCAVKEAEDRQALLKLKAAK